MAYINVPSWRSLTTCATSGGSRYILITSPLVTLTLVKCKSSEKLSENTGGGKKCQWTPPIKLFLIWKSPHCCSSSAPAVNFIDVLLAIFITYIFWSVLQQQSDLAHCCWSLKGGNRRLKCYWHQLQFTLHSDANNSFGKGLFLKTTEKNNV